MRVVGPRIHVSKSQSPFTTAPLATSQWAQTCISSSRRQSSLYGGMRPLCNTATDLKLWIALSQDLLKTGEPEEPEKLFGASATMLFCGDFRQTLPVVPRGSRRQIVNASLLRKSRLWSHMEVFHLTRRICVWIAPQKVMLSQLGCKRLVMALAFPQQRPWTCLKPAHASALKTTMDALDQCHLSNHKPRNMPDSFFARTHNPLTPKMIPSISSIRPSLINFLGWRPWCIVWIRCTWRQ